MKEPKLYKYNGVMMTAYDIAELSGADLKLLWPRLKAGWKVEKAIKGLVAVDLSYYDNGMMKSGVDDDCKKKQKRDEANFKEFAGFAQCSARHFL